MKRVRVVIDTNILLSALIAGVDSPPQKIFRKFKNQEFILVTSLNILAEIEDVINRPHLVKKYKLSRKERKNLIKDLIDLSMIVEGKIEVDVVRNDPDDNKFISCAVEGKADYVISGDKHLLGLKKFKSIRILTAQDFLKITVSSSTFSSEVF